MFPPDRWKLSLSGLYVQFGDKVCDRDRNKRMLMEDGGSGPQFAGI